MNRRGFLRGLGGILTACAAPQVLIGPQFKWKAAKTSSGVDFFYLAINPEWRDAPFEGIYFAVDPVPGRTFRPNVLQPIIWRRGTELKPLGKLPRGVKVLASPEAIMSLQGSPEIGYHEISFPFRYNERGEDIPCFVGYPHKKTS